MPHRRTCNGHRKSGEPCQGPAVTGADKCRMHLGVKAAPVAELGKAQARARTLFKKAAPSPEPVANPLEAYAAFAGRVMAWVQLMDDLLDDLKAVGYEHERNGEQIYAVVQMYQQAMALANSVLGSYARLKIDERLAAITEAQKTVVIRAITAALEEAGLDGEAMDAAKRRAARHLRAA